MLYILRTLKALLCIFSFIFSQRDIMHQLHLTPTPYCTSSTTTSPQDGDDLSPTTTPTTNTHTTTSTATPPLLVLSTHRDNLHYHAYQPETADEKQSKLLEILTHTLTLATTTTTATTTMSTTNTTHIEQSSGGQNYDKRLTTKLLVERLNTRHKHTHSNNKHTTNTTNTNTASNNSILLDKRKLPSTIVYVSRRVEAEVVAEFLKSAGILHNILYYVLLFINLLLHTIIIMYCHYYILSFSCTVVIQYTTITIN